MHTYHIYWTSFIVLLLVFTVQSECQISHYPYREHFDTVTAPSLPFRWKTSIAKNPAGDFVTSQSSPRAGSSPNCLSATDARVNQFVISPPFSFIDKIVDSLEFYERRTGTFTAGLLLEASLNDDTLFSLRLTDTLFLTTLNNGTYQRRIFPLPETLNGRSNVRFRWRAAGNPSGGGTAVLRLDDITIMVKKTKDLALSSLTVSPPNPKEGETITVTAGIKNSAMAGTYSGTIQLFDSASLITTEYFSHTFLLQDSLSIPLRYPNITSGRHPLSAVLNFSSDEDTANNVRTVIINAGLRQNTILINEVMYTPLTGMPEWVELVNNSSDTLQLSGFRISDAGSTKAVISGTETFPPYSYAVVTTDTNAFKSFFDIPSPKYQASFSALNNSGDAVVLYDRFGAVMDSTYYLPSWGGGTGRSLERIDTAFVSTASASWSTSRYPDGATPGSINSVTKKEFDACVQRVAVEPRFPVSETPVTISAGIGNIGRVNLTSLHAALFVDSNTDSLFTANEQRQETSLPYLTANDSVTVTFAPEQFSQGSYRIGIRVSANRDDDTTNNIRSAEMIVGVPPASIIVTEIMYAPAEEMPEWIEIYNASSAAVDIGGWTVSDNGSARVPLTAFRSIIPAGSYAVITSDSLQLLNGNPASSTIIQSALPSLNNTTPDAVVIRDNRGMMMDSVRYLPQWGGSNGNSLQRYDRTASSIDSANWRSAAPSPGNENPIARKDIDAGIHTVVSIKSINGFRIMTTLVNCGRSPMGDITVLLYHDRNTDSIPDLNELLSSSTIDLFAPLDSTTIQYDWTMTNRGKQSLIAQIDSPDDQRQKNNIGFGIATNSFPAHTLVINEIMYEPLSGQSEFVELLNRSTDTVDIAEWKLMDQPSSSGSRAMIPLSMISNKISPGGMVMIASDSSIVSQFPLHRSSSIIIHSALSLSNNGEDLVLTDITGTIIDSVRYSPVWHLQQISTGGRSLERIDPNGRSTDGRNWSSSVGKNGATPLQQNSVFIGSIASTGSLSLQPNPFSPDQDGSEDFLSINYSIPSGSSTIRIRIFDVTGRLIRRLVQTEPSPSSGSVIWNGLDDDGHRVRIGMYIILLEALDHFGTATRTMKDVVVVARKLK